MRGLVILTALVAVTGCNDGLVADVVAATTGSKSSGTSVPRISSTPRLRLPDSDPGKAVEFHQVAGAILGPQALLTVLNYGTAQLMVFDGTGEHLRTVGRKGQGPGEFSRPTFAPTIGNDSLFVADRQGRLSVFWPGSGRIDIVGNPGTFGDAAALTGRKLFVYRSLTAVGANSPGGITSNRVAVDVVDVDGGGSRGLGSYSGKQLYVAMPSPEEMQDPSQRPRVRFLDVPFSTDPGFAPSPRGLYVREGSAAEIKEVTEDGTILRIIRVNVSPVAVSEGTFRSAVSEEIASLRDDERPVLARFYENMDAPEQAPYFGRLLTDPAGRLWAEYLGIERGKSRAWMIFEKSGAVIGTVRIPGSGKLVSVSDDAIVTLSTDQLGIESLEVYDVGWEPAR